MTDNATDKKSFSISFGEPESVLSSSIADYLGVFLDSHKQYYEPPVSQKGLVQLSRANAHHGTIPYFKRNLLRKFYIDNSVLSANDLGNAGYDYMLFGHCYFQAMTNRFGNVVQLKHLPALPMRRMKDQNMFCQLQKNKDPIIFKEGEVIQLKEYDPNQNIYGSPQYLGGVQSVLLNESATLFRRRYYNNGAHMGYIFYTADANLDKEDEKALKDTVKKSKGVGNFRSMFLNLPGGKPDSVKIIPVGDIATKDEFEKIKNISRNDVLSMWRMPAALAGIMPENTGGYGDIEKISRVHYENEVVPMHDVFLQLNNMLINNKKIGFKDVE